MLNMLTVNKILLPSWLFWHLQMLMAELQKLHPQFGPKKEEIVKYLYTVETQSFEQSW
jgi:hypothetical protein